MENMHLLRTVDYTLNRKGEVIYTFCDEDCNYINYGSWKTQKAAIQAFKENPWKVSGYNLRNEIWTVHTNTAHWDNLVLKEFKSNKIGA